MAEIHVRLGEKVLKFAANLGFMWTELPLLDRIAAASRNGFRAVELHFPYDIPPEEIRRCCAENGVKLLGINTDVGPDDSGLAAVPGREKEALARIDQALDYAKAAGGTSVHVMAGKIDPAEKAEARRVFTSALRHAAERAEALDLVVLLEPINQRNMPGYFYSTVEEAADIIAEIGGDRLRIMFDCYHVAISQGDVLTRLRTHFASVGHVQIAAVPSRAEPDEGEIAYKAVFNELVALGYRGWVGCEYRPRTDTERGLSWFAALGVVP